MGQLESKEQFQKQSNVFNTRKLDKDLEQDVQRSMSIGAINTLARPQLDAGSGQAGEKKKDANEIRRSGTIRLNKTSSKVIRENKTVVKPQTREEKARAGILSMRTRLKNIEDTLLKDTMVPRMQRVDFNTLSNFKKKKRIEAAVAREDNAAYIENYMKNEHTEQVDNYPIQNPERLKLFLDDFMNNVADKEADITSDENFARSLKFNYELTRTAQEMKNYLIDAADKGYLPDGIDMDAIQKKIAYFGELKEYLDARVKVVTSPFYKYFSKADMNYTDHQINKLQEKFNSADEKYKKDNADIFEYLSAIKKLRSLNIKRSKGIASREKAIEEKARHEAEMVRTRTEKRELMDKLSEQAMNFKGADRYLDKDYDARYSKERFDFLAEEFSHVKLSDLHFADFRDMTDYHEDNVRLFEQAREMEHMFFLAVRRGDADDWSEDQMIRMRAKIRSFDAMEKLTSHMQAWVLQNRRDTLDKFTYREIWEKAVHNTGADYLASDMGNLPELGSDLEKFYNSVLKTYKDEHNDRAKTIRSMYGLMHARKNPDYDPDDEHSPEWIPGEIEQAELDRRVAGFQKNAVIMDYVRGGEAYYQSVTQNRNRLFFEEYQRKYGVDPRTVLVPTRTMMRYIGGKSGEEITRIVKTLSEGTEEEKQKIRNAVIEESRNYDIKAATGDDPEALLDNYAYKSRMEGVIANLGEMKEYFDPEEAKMIEGLYQHGHHNAETPSAFGQNIEDFRTCHGLELADLLKETPQLEEIRNWLDEYIGDENPELVYNSKGEDVVSTSPIGSLSFTGRAGDSDRLGANPQLARAIMDLAGNLSDDESEEELIDMVEGLTFIQREKPNMKDNDIYNYARDRWLRATKKFYDILYKSIKRYENTYGTLSADLPTACFMHSLGDGQGEYFRRTRFSQDMTQIVDELSSKYKGREVPLGEVLVEEKLLDRSEYKDAQAKCPNYYQTTATLGLQMIQTLDAIFKTMNPDPDGWGLLCAKPKGLINAEYLRLNNTFGGPQLSNAEQRKYWKTAIDTGYKGVVGDEIQLDYTRKRLNILSSSERKRIKKRREADNRVYAGTCSVLNVRTNDLYNSTLAKLNNFTLNEEQKNLIKKMIAFHPGLYRDTDENRPEDMLEISRFDGNLISFLGLGAKEGTGKDLKRRAFDYFLNRADKLRTEASDGAYDVEAIMTSGNVRTSRDVVLDSQLIKMETCHRMYDVLQEMAADRKEMNWLQSKSRAKLSKGVFANFELEAIRYELSSNFYVTMGDIGGRFETEEGRKYLAIQALGQSMTGYSTGSVENNVFGDPVMRDALRSAGIRVDDILREEKPKEEKTDKSVGAFDENLFKEELGQDVEDEIDYDDEKEKEKEKTKAAPVRTGRSKKKAKADPVRRGRPDGIDLNTLEGIEAARKLPYDQRLKIFNPIDREAHEDALVRLGIPIPQNGEELAELQQAMHEVYEDEKHVQHLRRKEGVTEEMDKHLEWLGGYYLTQNKTLDQNRAQVPINRVNIPADLNAVSDYNNLENTYEAQTGLNCYCVAGQMIFNQYVARKKGTKDVERIINQHDFRNYQPVFKPYDPALAQMGIDQEAYDDAVTEVMQYAGEHATKAGNIFELGDFLFDKLDEQGYQNNCMRRMVFNIPTADTERNLIKAGNMQSVMMNKVAEIIDAGGVVALGVFTPAGYAHYVTVTGIVGDKFKVLDSSGYGGTSKLEDISEYFGPDRSVELTWLSDEKTPEEWRAEFSNLEYDPQTGYSVRELTADMALFAAQNRGISVKKTPAEMGPDREDILEFAYIRNPLSQTAEAYERGGAGQPGAVGVQEPTSYKKTTRSKKSQAPAGEKDTDKKKSEEKSVEETTEKTDEKAVETTAGQTKDKTTEKATEKTVDKAGEKTIKEAKDKTADKAAGKIANTTVWKASDKYVTTEFPKELKGKIKNLRIHIEPEVIDEYLGKDVITEELEKKFEGYEAQISARMKAGGADASAEVQQKQEIQSHFMAEMQNLIRDRKGRCGLIAWYAAGTMLDANKEGSFANRMSDDPKHRLIARELLIMKDKDGKTSNVGRIYQGFIGYGVEDLFEGLERLDLKQFAAANDAEFVSGFAAKYDILSKLDVFEDTYRYFEENDRVHNRGNKATAARAKLDALREIRAAYEERIGQITSGDYVTSEAKPVPQSLSIDSIEGRHAEILADVRQKAAEEAVRILREELGGVDLNGKPTEVVQQLFDKVQNDESRQFPEDDAAFLRQHKNEMNEVVARCGQADYDRYDVYLIEILEKGTFRGQELEGELLDHCRHGIAEYANLRRSHLGRCKAEDWAKKFDRAYGIDTDNPFLNDHPEYRAYKKLSDEGNLDTIGETRALQERCYTAAHDVMTRLIENGYSVNEREESKLRDRKRCDEAIETVRSEYEDKYYKAHPVKKGKQRKRMEIPRVYICGKYYTDYLTIIGSTNDSVFDRMKNLNVKMSDEDRKALHQSLSLMEELNRRYIEVEVPNRTAGSDMLLITSTLKVKYVTEAEAEREKVRTLLQKYGINANKSAPWSSTVNPEKHLTQTAKSYNRLFEDKYDKTAKEIDRGLFGRKRTKKDANVRAAGNRTSSSLAACMYGMGKVSVEECNNLYRVMNTKVNKADPEELQAKAAGYEKIFGAILSFDVSELKIRSLEDCIDPACMNARLMTSMCYDFKPKFFKEYEKMIDNPDVNCTLTAEQLNEVRARQALLSDANSFFTIYVKCYELAKKYKLNLQDELAKSEEEHADAAVKVSDNRELTEFYGMLSHINRALKGGDFKPGEDPGQALERQRNKLRKKQS